MAIVLLMHKFEAVGGEFPNTCRLCACFRESVHHFPEASDACRFGHCKACWTQGCTCECHAGRPDPRLVELEGTRSFPKQCPDCREHHPDGRPCGKRDPLAELLAAAELPIELRKCIALTGLDSGVRKWHKRLRAAVAAFEEGK